jgi:hypothetical protein
MYVPKMISVSSVPSKPQQLIGMNFLPPTTSVTMGKASSLLSHFLAHERLDRCEQELHPTIGMHQIESLLTHTISHWNALFVNSFHVHTSHINPQH